MNEVEREYVAKLQRQLAAVSVLLHEIAGTNLDDVPQELAEQALAILEED